MEARIVEELERYRSRRFAAVEGEHPTESLLPLDRLTSLSTVRHRPDQSIIQPPMVSLTVVMVHVFGHCAAQRN